jgi:predicted DNA-binding protein
LGRADARIAYRLPRSYRAALLALARSRGMKFSRYMRMIDEEHLREMSNNLNQLSNNHERLDWLVRRFILLCRQEVAIAAGAPATQERCNELQEIAWKAIAQAEE